MPQIYYAGNIQGRHFNEQGQKGCLLVEGDHLKLTTRFIPTQFIRFDEATITTKQFSKQGILMLFKNLKRMLDLKVKHFIV